MIVYKTLNGRLSPYQSYPWPIPEKEPTYWLEINETPKLCVRGFHGWLTLEKAKQEGFEVYEMELEGQIVQDDEKAAGQRARLLRKLFPDPEKWINAVNNAKTIIEKIEVYKGAQREASGSYRGTGTYLPVFPCFHPVGWGCSHPEWHNDLEERLSLTDKIRSFSWEARTMYWLSKKGVPLG